MMDVVNRPEAPTHEAPRDQPPTAATAWPRNRRQGDAAGGPRGSAPEAAPERLAGKRQPRREDCVHETILSSVKEIAVVAASHAPQRCSSFILDEVAHSRRASRAIKWWRSPRTSAPLSMGRVIERTGI